MNGRELLLGMTYIEDKFLMEEETKIPVRSPGIRKRPILIAAIIALMLLLVGCVAMAWSLRDLKIADEKTTLPSYIGYDGNVVVPDPVGRAVLSLHGYQGSAAYLAHQEWFAFRESYDADGRRMAEAEKNLIDVPEAYEAYSPYTQEMIDKIDQIAAKYSLKLLGAFAPFQSYESHIFYEAMGINSLLLPESRARIGEAASGYFYEGGNFKIDFSMSMPNEKGQWPYEMHNSMYYSRKDCFDTVSFGIKDLEDTEQWSYTTASGVEVLLVGAENGARILCDREDAFIVVTIDGMRESKADERTTYMTRRRLEKVADELDLMLQPRQADMVLARAELSKFKTQQQNEAVSNRVSSGSYIQKDYTAYVSKLLNGGYRTYPVTHYALVDASGDGSEELLLGTQDTVFEVVTVQNDGNAHMVLCGGGSNTTFEICEDGLILRRFHYGRQTTCSYFRQEEYEGEAAAVLTEELNHAPEGEYPWTRLNLEDGCLHPISQETFRDIMNSHPTVSVEMTPLEAFPGVQKDTATEPAAGDDYVQQSYCEYIRYCMENRRAYMTITYAAYDLTGDGCEELFLGTGDSTDPYFGEVVTVRDGKVEVLFSNDGSLSGYRLYENGIVAKEYTDVERLAYCKEYYRFGDGELVLIDFWRLEDAEMNWYRSMDGDREPELSYPHEEGFTIRNETYGMELNLGFRPLAQFPFAEPQ